MAALYNYRVRLQNVMKRNYAVGRACAIASQSESELVLPAEQLTPPFLLVSSTARAVVDIDATADLSEVVLRFSHPFVLCDDAGVLAQMHDGGWILR